jgi:hypothetical protein
MTVNMVQTDCMHNKEYVSDFKLDSNSFEYYELGIFK